MNGVVICPRNVDDAGIHEQQSKAAIESFGFDRSTTNMYQPSIRFKGKGIREM